MSPSLPIILSPSTPRRPDTFLGFAMPGLPYHVAAVAPSRVHAYLGFASATQARHDGWPNRVYLRYGLIVHLRLLPTPPHGDAVTSGYMCYDFT